MAKRVYDDEQNEDVMVPASRRRQVEDEPVDEEPRTRRTRPALDDDGADESPKARKSAKGADADAEDADYGNVGIDVDFGDERVSKRPGRLERLTLDGAKTVRFAFVPGFKVKAAHNHYVEGQGTFVCNSTDEKQAECCKKLGNPGMRAVALVVHYENASPKDGSLPKDKRTGEYDEFEWSVKYLRMSRTNFSEISKKRMEDETLYDFDLVMTEKENGIGYQFEKISKSPAWRLDEDMEADVLEAAEKFRDGKALGYALGKKVDDLEYKSIIRKAQKAEKESGNEDEI